MRPDFVDGDQLIERLGMDRASFRRLQQRGAAPDPDLHFNGNPLWWWDQVEHWSRERRRLTRREQFRKRLPAVDLVGLDAIARRLHVTGRVAYRWRRTGTLVAPDYRWSFAEAWLWPTVEAWARHQRVARPVTPVVVSADVATTEDSSDGADAASLDELDALLARLDELKGSLDGTARADTDGAAHERDMLEQRMHDVADFIGRVDR